MMAKNSIIINFGVDFIIEIVNLDRKKFIIKAYFGGKNCSFFGNFRYIFPKKLGFVLLLCWL